MSRRTVGPFSALEALQSGLSVELSDEVLADYMWLVHDALEAEGCECHGKSAGRVRDPGWAGDLSELIIRSIPHEIIGSGGVVEIVAVKLATLRVEVDDENEVCVWIYEESGV